MTFDEIDENKEVDLNIIKQRSSIDTISKYNKAVNTLINTLSELPLDTNDTKIIKHVIN